jgi:hypothetical protein
VRKSLEKRLEEQLSHVSNEEYRACLRRRGIIPLADVEIALEEGKEETVAEYLALWPAPDPSIIIRLAEQGDLAALSDYLDRNPGPDPSILKRLAKTLDPGVNGDPDWRLVFQRRRAGNPVTSDEALMNLIWVGSEAIELYERLITEGHEPRGLWKRVRGEIGDKHGLKDRLVQKAIATIKAIRKAK